ncbi:hypothetical protein WICMUC_004619 [Wickerhamomyces mucosus]|uniref:Luciferase-like domain-containing protein n=1 Tax=Wickerhamomyces mucosus TaxID=1378264 RepID=A0A9P8PHD6_9ASCO|nr:hypothetical protein WICMUC_004619 [Wickerhamomyces mucosus]
MTQPPTKKQKVSGKRDPLILNFFQALTPVLHAPGQWKNPRDESRKYYTAENWIKTAKIAERGKIHGIFFGDSLAPYGGYNSKDLDGPFNFQEAAKSGNNFPKNDPTAYLAAMAINTKNLSFGFTCTTLSEHPYHFARRMATLDHISKGRVGWNVVTSFLESAARNLLNNERLPAKPERYEKADEYLQVFYELLLSSWRDDGVVFDREHGIFSNPDAIREINFEGKYFKVPGPQISEPSPQRIPLIIQAGTSEKGALLGAKHSELIFLGGESPEIVAEKIANIRKLATEKYNRDIKKLKFVTIARIIVGKTSEEAQAKWKEIESYKDVEGIMVQVGGRGIDLSLVDSWDEDLTKSPHESIRLAALGVSKGNPGVKITKKFFVDSHFTTFIGSAEEVADEIEHYVEVSGIDGFNFTNVVFPENFEDIVDLLIPELQKRGLAQTEYAVEGGTYREQIYREKGHTFVPEDHYAYGLRWKAGVSKEDFEEHLKELKKKQEELKIYAYK